MSSFPLLAIPFLLINALLFFTDSGLAQPLATLTLPSGAAWSLTMGDLAVVIGLAFLYFEIFKSTRTGTSSIFDHVLSLVLFVIALIEFLLVAKAGSTAFFLLLMMMLIDVIAGFTVSISVARRDVDLVRGSGN
jgi:hypothetical protein